MTNDHYVNCPHCKQPMNVSRQFHHMEKENLSYMAIYGCTHCKFPFGLVYGIDGLQCYETLLLNSNGK